MKDHIICANCNKEQLVNVGEEICPNCNSKGTLMWANESEQEVEDNYIIKNIIFKTEHGEFIQGDNLEIMDVLEDEYYDNCISDFPYNLAFMGKKWDNQKNFYNWCYQRAEKLYPKIKKGGYVLIFGHHKSNHRMKCAFEDVGFKIVEEIDYVYGSGFPKNQDIGKLFDRKYKKERKIVGTGDKHNSRSFDKGNKEDNIYSNFKGGIPYITKPSSDLAKQWDGWKTSGLKPAKEIITVFQKPLDKNYCNNIEKYNCGAMNIDACRIPYKNKKDLETVKAKCNFTKNSKSIGFGTEDSLYGTGITPLKQAKKCVKEQGRFPANIIFDDKMGKILDNQSGISKSTGGCGEKSMGALGNKVYGKYAKNIKATHAGGLGDEGGASRYFLNINFKEDDFIPFFYCPKPSKKEKGTNNKHITVKPKKLIKWLIKLVTPINGKTLDITAGSGTHGLSCEELNREEGYNIQWTNIELMNSEEEPYCNIAKSRIKNYSHNIK